MASKVAKRKPVYRKPERKFGPAKEPTPAEKLQLRRSNVEMRQLARRQGLKSGVPTGELAKRYASRMALPAARVAMRAGATAAFGYGFAAGTILNDTFKLSEKISEYAAKKRGLTGYAPEQNIFPQNAGYKKGPKRRKK